MFALNTLRKLIYEYLSRYVNVTSFCLAENCFLIDDELSETQTQSFNAEIMLSSRVNGISTGINVNKLSQSLPQLVNLLVKL